MIRVLQHLPRRIIVGMVDTKAFNGDNTKNPFNFQHFKVKKVGLFKNGIEYPTPQITLNCDKKNYSEAYQHLFESLHAENSPFVPDLTEKDFGNGFTLFSWEMSPDLSGADNMPVGANKNANIRLLLEFEEPLVEAITLIVYYQLDMRMSINQSRQVTVESS
jgi:hypothetical protein